MTALSRQRMHSISRAGASGSSSNGQPPGLRVGAGVAGPVGQCGAVRSPRGGPVKCAAKLADTASTRPVGGPSQAEMTPVRRLHLVPLLVAAAALVAACTPAPSPDPFFTIRCPVTGTVSFSNDWHAPRAGGRLHEGNDIMAPRNTPVVAVVDGTFRQSLGTLQGNGAWVQGESGNTFFYAHFDHYNGNNRRVKAGDVIGFVGNTGDAAGGPTHTHF